MEDNLDVKESEDVRVVKTDVGSESGQDKCPKCGATDISTNISTGKLRCNFCRCEFDPVKVSGLEDDIGNLKGKVYASGVQDIVADTKDVLTFKCSSCGAEVVIDTSNQLQARCHWCRNTLSINEQIPNGSVPDVVLPFAIKKDDARVEIEKFVGKRKFYAHPKFKQEFTTENIMGVYFPYMLIDVNAHANFSGEGEHKTREYYRGSSEHREKYYDADLYHIEREFDITIEGLSIESNSDRLNVNAKDKTNNIINSIMPFDVENSVKYNANYLKGFTSERRDTNVSEISNLAYAQSKDIARYAANDTLKQYDRGVAWKQEDFDVKGEQWKSAYLPVWLYSYQEVKGDRKLLHYVCVNARTKETMGSVPIHMPKLILVSVLVEILGIICMGVVDFDYEWLFLFSGFVYFFIIYGRYRNNSARHTYELETKKNMSNLRKVDKFVTSRTGLRNSTMTGANNKRLNGSTVNTSKVNSILGNQLDSISKTIPFSDTIKDKINKK